MSRSPKILVVSHDPSAADVRKSVLEANGFQVLAASDLLAVRKHCVESHPDLVMIGYSLPASEKRRVWLEVTERCKTPVLELHLDGAPSLMEPTYVHASKSADDFLETVKSILRPKQ
jgi:DNA-binding response OmpR family regulator